MNKKEDAISYLRSFDTIINKAFTIFNDFEELKITKLPYIIDFNLIKEKPSFIEQDIWDDLFVKVDLPAITESRIEKIYFVEIESVYVGILVFEYGYYFVCFSADRAEDIGTKSIERVKQYIKNKSINALNLSSSLNKFKNLYKGLQEYYGEDYVQITFPKIDPDFINISSAGYLSIFVRHSSFYVKDDFGLGYWIQAGLSEFAINGSSVTPCFTNLQPSNKFLRSSEIIHPHVRQNSNFAYMQGICKGRNSPINMALSAYTEDPTEDNGFNLAINYDNLIKQESEAGGPHIRLRKAIFSRSSSSISTMTEAELIESIISKEVIPVVEFDKLISISISEGSINEYLSSQEDGSTTNKKYLRKDGTVYDLKRKTDSLSASMITKGEFCFYGEIIPIQTIPTTEDHYYIEDPLPDRKWRNFTKSAPTPIHIKNVEKKLESIVNKKLISNKNIIPYEYNSNTPKEIIGIKRIKRGANPGNFQFSQAAN